MVNLRYTLKTATKDMIQTRTVIFLNQVYTLIIALTILLKELAKDDLMMAIEREEDSDSVFIIRVSSTGTTFSLGLNHFIMPPRKVYF